MKHILTITFILLIQMISNAQQPLSASPVSAPVLPVPAPTTPAIIDFDSYSNIPAKEEKVRLRKLAVELKKDDYLLKSSTVYIIAYADQRSSSGEALKRISRVTRYLVRNEKIDSARIYSTFGGYRENRAVELFIVPPGASQSMPSPTIDENEIKKRRRAEKPVKRRSNVKKKRV